MAESPRWITFPECKRTDFVNCNFKDSGECQNPKHHPKKEKS